MPFDGLSWNHLYTFNGKKFKNQKQIFFSRIVIVRQNSIHNEAGLTGGEQDNGFQTTVFGGVNVEGFEFLHLFLEYAYVVHESDHTICGHWRRMQPGCGQQRGNVQWHRTL